MTAAPEEFVPKAVEGSGISKGDSQVALVPTGGIHQWVYAKACVEGGDLIGQSLLYSRRRNLSLPDCGNL